MKERENRILDQGGAQRLSGSIHENAAFGGEHRALVLAHLAIEKEFVLRVSNELEINMSFSCVGRSKLTMARCCSD